MTLGLHWLCLGFALDWHCRCLAFDFILGRHSLGIGVALEWDRICIGYWLSIGNWCCIGVAVALRWLWRGSEVALPLCCIRFGLAFY